MSISMLYNPQEMDEPTFIDSFVVRQAILEKLLQPIRETAPGEPFRHIIIQSIRGQGKTTLLRRISISVRDDKQLSSWLIPVLFKEEEYGIIKLCRLWERTAELLGPLPEFQDLPQKFEQAMQSPHYEKDCFFILRDTLEKHDKHLLLLIDNIGEMLSKFALGDQQRLREILITCPRIRIIGASSATLEQHYDYGKPFFQYFKLQSLDGLGREETHTLLLSRGTKAQQQRIKKLLKENPGKVEALRQLTSGVPRTLILLFEIFADKDGSAMQDLEQLLDRVTPLYKHRLDDLPPQQQQIVQEIALGWDAMYVKEIAQKTRLDSKLVSAQLQQLEKGRVIRKIPTTTKNHLYQLEERFFNIWCLMRLGRNGDKRRVMWLVKFLEIWYDDKELSQLASNHLKAMKKGKMQPHIALLRTQALAEAMHDMEFQDEFLSAAKSYLPNTVAEALPISDKSMFDAATEAYHEGDLVKAEELIRQLAEKGYSGAKYNLAILLEDLNRLEEAEDFYRQAAAEGEVSAMYNLANLLIKQTRLEEAEQFYRKAAAEGYVDAMNNLANSLSEQNRLEEAEQFYRQAAAKGNVRALYNLANLLIKQTRLEEAEQFYRQAAEKGHTNAMNNLANLFFYQKNQAHEALKWLKQAIEIEPNNNYYRFFYSEIELEREEYINAFIQIDTALAQFQNLKERDEERISATIIILCVKYQTAFALKIFEDEKYRHLNLKERLKPLYYAVLQEAGEAYKDQAQRMGAELAETVAEIRQDIVGWREYFDARKAERAAAQTNPSQ